MSRQVATSRADTLRGCQDRQGSLGGTWDLPEAASDHHNTFPYGAGTFRAVSDSPETFRKQHQTIGNDSQMTEIVKMVENGLLSVEMG